MRLTRRWLLLLAVAVVLVAVAWRLRAGSPGGGSVGPAVLPANVVSAADGDRLIVEPDAGIAPIDALLASPRRSLDLCVYELVDPTAESILARDAARGVAVRVILDHRLEASNNAAAYGFLAAHGVSVHWASSRFFASHEKAFVIDDRVSVVMSLNLTSRYYINTRDVAVVDHDPTDAHAIESVFDADFAGHPIRAPTGDDLAWSPDQSQADVLALINDARHSLLLESEELSSPPVISALVAAARRGVAVGIVMTDSDSWHPAFDAVTRAGGRVWVLHGETPLYIHAKILVADAGTSAGRALVGSQNLSVASLTDDRELGIVLTAPSLVDALGHLVESDAARGSPWTG